MNIVPFSFLVNMLTQHHIKTTNIITIYVYLFVRGYVNVKDITVIISNAIYYKLLNKDIEYISNNNVAFFVGTFLLFCYDEKELRVYIV